MVDILKIRQNAQKILTSFNIDKPPIPVEYIAEQLELLVKYKPFIGDKGNISGVFFNQKGKKIIGVNAMHSNNQQRFTIAHEIGHDILHQNAFIDREFFIKKRDENSSTGTNEEEIEANSFAAELLMPENMILKDIEDMDLKFDFWDGKDLIRLASRYKVSLQAMLIRLINLGKIPEEFLDNSVFGA